MSGLALASLLGCVEDAWAQHANPDPHARPRAPGPSALDVLRRSTDAGASARVGDPGSMIGGWMGDTVGDRFGRGALGSPGRYDRVRDGGLIVGTGEGTIGLGRRGYGNGDGGAGFGAGAMSLAPTGRARFEALVVEGPLPISAVRGPLAQVAGRVQQCLGGAPATRWIDVPVRVELAAPPTAALGQYDTDDATLRRCLAESLAHAVLPPSTPVTRASARFRLGIRPDAGR
jgi:hypothetical protein